MIIAVVDPGSGNLNSVRRALLQAGAMAGLSLDVAITKDATTVLAADRIVLPGQGAFRTCWNGLAALPGMMEALQEVGRHRRRPFLGICVGMQLLAECGLEHSPHRGLGWLPGAIAPMDPRSSMGECLPLPQMGWNRLQPVIAHPLLSGLPAEAYGYFVHSFSWTGGLASDLLATAEYGGKVVAMVGRDNVVGTQFHVEKSGLAGLLILRNFLRWGP